MMKALLIGGTGLISTGIVKHLLARGADVWMLNRAQRENTLPPSVHALTGDRYSPNIIHDVASQHFDVVIDMCCFDPKTCYVALEAFAGKTKHFIFCSTVCTYGVKIPPNVLIDEHFPQQPISTYGLNKLACEHLLLDYNAKGILHTTIIRPSHTYGPGSPMIDQLEPDAVAWDRIEKGKPVLVAGDGLGLWVSTHRDDCGKLFAAAALSPKSFGHTYNATRDEHLTWREYYRQVAAALGRNANLIFMPADWIWRHDEKRFGLLKEITAFHGAYTSARAKHDFPEFHCTIDLTHGAAETFADIRRRNAWRNSDDDTLYDKMVAEAIEAGAEPTPA